MKKITLFFALSFVSLVGFAQETENTSNSNSESIERQSEYIIVLDDVIVDDNIDLLLTGTKVSKELELDNHHHELVHDAPDNYDIESKFVEGAFSYNEYAVNYAAGTTELVDLS
ncbi:hypothetical protein [Lutimonas sp.]|uniref:hypothetical protein n=1 Tax=Lutimonas sp. TaxID=1872403 RepID=UPI003D9AC097